MNLYEQRRGEILVLQPTSRLDSISSRNLHDEMAKRLDAGDVKIVLDFKDVEYVSSAGLRVLLILGKEIEARGGALTLCALRPNVRRVFDVSGFLGLFPIYGTLEEAIAGIDDLGPSRPES